MAEFNIGDLIQWSRNGYTDTNTTYRVRGFDYAGRLTLSQVGDGVNPNGYVYSGTYDPKYFILVESNETVAKPERKDWTDLTDEADRFVEAYALTDPNGLTGPLIKSLRDAIVEESYRD